MSKKVYAWIGEVVVFLLILSIVEGILAKMIGKYMSDVLVLVYLILRAEKKIREGSRH